METINIENTGDAKEVLKVVITETETVPEKVVEHVKFDGTLSDLVNEELPRLLKEKESLEAQVVAKQVEIDAKEALRDKIQVELDKLPVVKEVVEK